MEHKENVIKAISSDTHEEIEELLHSGWFESTSFGESMDFLSAKDHGALWQKLSIYTSEVIVLLNTDEEDESANDGIFSDEDVKVVSTLKRVSHLVSKYLEIAQFKNLVPLFETIMQLHEILIPLDDGMPGAQQLKVSIARACERCWSDEWEGAENLVTQLLPFLLLAALSVSALDADVKRVFQLRGALSLLDFDDPSIESIKGLVLRCLIHPAFMRSNEGRRFLSFIFTVNQGLHGLIIGVMKPQIASGTRGVAAAYGDILFRAWKEASSSSVTDTTGSGDAAAQLASIEECLQGLVHEAIHAADRRYFRGLRVLLGEFHRNKRIKDVDSMLLRVYGPILWRSLRCANALVRAQATMLFFDAFPLQTSDATAAEADAVLQKQFDLLTSLLKDNDHRVRAAAASGVSHILADFWEALPPKTTRQILSYLISTLGCDASCANVRLAVITGLSEILDQPLAHGVLKGLLPLLANTLHDKSERVRLSFMELLLKVKNVRDMHFYEVVSVDQLQARLAADASRPVLCSAMTDLLLNSYYPQAEDGVSAAERKAMGPEQLRRCLRFVKEDERAAIAFYSHFHRFVSVGSVAKITVMLFSLIMQSETLREYAVDSDALPAAVLQPPEKTKKGGKRNRAEATASASAAGAPAAGAAGAGDDGVCIDTLRVSVLRVILAMLSSVSKPLTQAANQPARELLQKYFVPEGIRSVFKSLTRPSGHSDPGDNSAATSTAQAVPLFLKIVTIVWEAFSASVPDDARNDDGDHGTEDVDPSTGKSKSSNSNSIIGDAGGKCQTQTQTLSVVQRTGLRADLIIEEFAYAWVKSHMDGNICNRALRQHAFATADVLCSIKEEGKLLETILGSLKSLAPKTNNPSAVRALEICSSPVAKGSAAGGGGVTGKRKQKAVSSPAPAAANNRAFAAIIAEGGGGVQGVEEGDDDEESNGMPVLAAVELLRAVVECGTAAGKSQIFTQLQKLNHDIFTASDYKWRSSVLGESFGFARAALEQACRPGSAALSTEKQTAAISLIHLWATACVHRSALLETNTVIERETAAAGGASADIFGSPCAAAGGGSGSGSGNHSNSDAADEAVSDLRDWVSSTIVPAICGSQGLLLLAVPGSPIPVCPPRSRARLDSARKTSTSTAAKDRRRSKSSGGGKEVEEEEEAELPASESLAVRVLSAVVLVISDALVVGVSTNSFINALDMWVSALQTKAAGERGDMIVASLVPVLGRLCVVLAGGKGQIKGKGDNNDTDDRIARILASVSQLLSQNADETVAVKALLAGIKVASTGNRAALLESIATACLSHVTSQATEATHGAGSAAGKSSSESLAELRNPGTDSGESSCCSGGGGKAAAEDVENEVEKEVEKEVVANKDAVFWEDSAARQSFQGVLCRAPENALVSIAGVLGAWVLSSLNAPHDTSKSVRGKPVSLLPSGCLAPTGLNPAVATALLVDLSHKGSDKAQSSVKRILGEISSTLTKNPVLINASSFDPAGSDDDKENDLANDAVGVSGVAKFGLRDNVNTAAVEVLRLLRTAV